jgi:hypothetical protein
MNKIEVLWNYGDGPQGNMAAALDAVEKFVREEIQLHCDNHHTIPRGEPIMNEPDGVYVKPGDVVIWNPPYGVTRFVLVTGNVGDGIRQRFVAGDDCDEKGYIRHHIHMSTEYLKTRDGKRVLGVKE